MLPSLWCGGGLEVVTWEAGEEDWEAIDELMGEVRGSNGWDIHGAK